MNNSMGAKKGIFNNLSNRTYALPSVSIIIPVYNAEDNISSLIESLLNLDYPKELIEIIVVDNNSTDSTKELLRHYPVKLLEEKHIQSSYAARNTGIKNAKNEIIAFTDSDCIVSRQWVREGIMPFCSQSADLVAGKVEFFYSKQKTAAELYDSITHLQIKSNSGKTDTAQTANLFVKSSLFEKIGMFSATVSSGADIQWACKATREGFILTYAPEAVVRHPARQLRELTKKCFRIGTGLINVWLNRGEQIFKIIYLIVKLFFPPRLSYILMLIKENGSADMRKKLLSIWLIAYLCNISKYFGILFFLLFSLRKVVRSSASIKPSASGSS